MADYMHSIVDRRRGLAVYEGLGVYRDAMRIFIRDNITTEIGVDLDKQIFRVLTGTQREELATVLDRSPRLNVIHAIDTKHFPRLINRYWASFGKHFNSDRSYIDRMANLHNIRNLVCHPEMRDVSSRCAKVSFRDMQLILDQTGPDGVTEMIQQISDGLSNVPKQVRQSDASPSEVEGAFEKVWLDIGEVSELVDGLVDRHTKGYSDSRFSALRQAGRKLADGTQIFGNAVKRMRKP